MEGVWNGEGEEAYNDARVGHRVVLIEEDCYVARGRLIARCVIPPQQFPIPHAFFQAHGHVLHFLR